MPVGGRKAKALWNIRLRYVFLLKNKVVDIVSIISFLISMEDCNVQ